MLFTTSFVRLFVTLLLTVALCQCVQTADSSLLKPTSKITKQYTLSLAEYLTLANNETGNAKQALLITAAMRALNEGHWQQAQTILSQTSELSPMQIQQKHILDAKINLMRGRYRPALGQLASMQGVKSLPTPYSAYYHDILAQAYEHLGLKNEGLSERIQLEELLPDETSRQSNRRALWSTLMAFPIAELQTFATESGDNTPTQGWAQLALISKNNDQPKTMIKAIDQWQNMFPQHAANRLLPDPLHLIEQKMYPNPDNLALLLPLSGVLAGPGNAIKDGFLAAAKNKAVKVTIYDTQKEPAADLYQKAIAEGAQYVVGPLSKADVTTVAALDNPVPTLLLNEVDTVTHPNAFQFGLSPSNEANQVAIKAGNQGYRHALIIAPEGAWGKEVAHAFTQQWQSQGGQVMDTLIYQNNADLTANIREALHISKSEEREKHIKRLLGETIQTRPSRRNDIDMIFLLAYPSKARQIMPLLKYYYAGDLPVYATSTVYSGNLNSMKDNDLNGIIFCDMPWVFANQMGNKPWPEQFNSYNRLYALGIDSFNLATQLNQLIVFPSLGFNDKSGLLYLKSANHKRALVII
jgi:outer membrane PBP1 activator LpoA protein